MYENGASGGGAFAVPQERQAPRRRGVRPSRAPSALGWRLAVGLLVALPALVGSAWLAATLIDPLGPLGRESPLADAESLTALAQSPADDAAWLALAYAESVRHGGTDAVALGWLQRSYDVAPFGPDTSLWRIRFALDHWQAMTPELRREVLDEINATWRPRRRELIAMVNVVRDPAGRLALSLMIRRMRMEAEPSSLAQ